MRVQSWAEFSRAVKAGVSAGRVAATVVSRVERRTKTGNKMGIIGLSDPSGHYEAVLFAEGLAAIPRPARARRAGAARSSPPRRRATRCAPASSRPSRSIRPPRKLQKGLRVFLRDQTPLEPVAKRLEGKGDGEVSMVLLLDGGNEVEVKLPGRFKVSPQIAGAIKAVPGVVEVQMM